MACGACQFLKKKCEEGCVFAPYFCCSENMDTAKFRAILRFFGAKNFSKLLKNVRGDERGDAVATISYEAAARIENPIQGCLSNVFALRIEVAKLMEELAAAYAELDACSSLDETSQMPVLESDTNPYVQQQLHFPEDNSIVGSSDRSSQVQSQQLTFPGDLQSILPGKVAVSNYLAEAESGEQGSRMQRDISSEQGSGMQWDISSEQGSRMQWDISSLGRSTAQQQMQMEINPHNFGHGVGPAAKRSRQKHPNINDQE